MALTKNENEDSGVLCEGSKMVEFTSNVDACHNLAELDFFLSLNSGDDILGPLCASFEEKVSIPNQRLVINGIE